MVATYYEKLRNAHDLLRRVAYSVEGVLHSVRTEWIHELGKRADTLNQEIYKTAPKDEKYLARSSFDIDKMRGEAISICEAYLSEVKELTQVYPHLAGRAMKVYNRDTLYEQRSTKSPELKRLFSETDVYRESDNTVPSLETVMTLKDLRSRIEGTILYTRRVEGNEGDGSNKQALVWKLKAMDDDLIKTLERHTQGTQSDDTSEIRDYLSPTAVIAVENTRLALHKFQDEYADFDKDVRKRWQRLHS